MSRIGGGPERPKRDISPEPGPGLEAAVGTWRAEAGKGRETARVGRHQAEWVATKGCGSF